MDRSHPILLSRNDVAALMRPADYLAAVEAGFRAAASRQALSPAPLHLPAALGGFHAKAALIDDGRAFAAVKINANFPGNLERTGRPTIQGVLALFDAADGALLALMDSIEITLRRTAAASALAARFLARPDCGALAVCGCGVQAAAQVEALTEILPLRRVLAWDMDHGRALAFARDMTVSADLHVSAVADLAAAVSQADAVVTCTTAASAFLRLEHVRAGTFVAAVGADSPAKSEIAPDLMAAAMVVCDAAAQCADMGDLRHAIAAGAMTASDVHAELPDLVSGRRQGRTDASQITLFDSTGVGLQDVASAVVAWRRAAELGVGTAWNVAG